MSNVYEAPQANLTPKRKKNENPITQEMIDNLLIGQLWVKTLTILGYVFGAFLIAVGVFSLFLSFSKGIIVLLLLSIPAFVAFKMSRFLHKYSKAISALRESGDIGDMLEAQEMFAKYMKWTVLMGIATFIIVIVTVIVAFFTTLAFAASAASAAG